MILLSLILPIYNVERYLPVCLDSLIKQDIDELQYEIICVNDGSTDRCEQIILKYQRDHGNIKLINRENCGVSKARNIGLEAAKGKFIWFVDPDDFVRTYSLKYILDMLEQTQADICNILYTGVPENATLATIEKEDNLFYLKEKRMFGSCWSHVVKREKSARLNEALDYGEDYLWEFETCALVEKQITVYPAVYFYRQRMDSAMHINSNDKILKYIKNMHKLAICYQKLQNNGKYSQLKNNIQDRVGLCVQSIIITMIKNKFSKKEIQNQITILEKEKLYPYRPLWFLLKPKKSLKLYFFSIFSFLVVNKYFVYGFVKLKGGNKS